MARLLPKTSERLIPEQVTSRDEHLMVLRHVFAYELAGTLLAGCGDVLDLGCGEGYGTSLLSGHVGSIVGLDVDAAVIAHAAEKYGSDGCRFQSYDGRDLPYDNGRFDAAVSFQVVEHVRDDRRYVSEVARVLKPQGRFLLTTPNRANRLRPGARPWNRFHVREYGAAELAELLGLHFSAVGVSGVTACPEIHRIEMDRVRQSLRTVALDPLNLRRFIPEGLKPLVTRLVRRVIPRKHRDAAAGDWASRYRLQDYFVTESDVDDSLDLLAACTR